MAIGLENPFPPPARRAAPRHGRTVAAACRGPGRPLGRRRRVRGGDTKGFLLFEFYVSVSPGHRTGTGTRRQRRRRRLLHYLRGTTHTRRENNNNKINKKEEKKLRRSSTHAGYTIVAPPPPPLPPPSQSQSPSPWLSAVVRRPYSTARARARQAHADRPTTLCPQPDRLRITRGRENLFLLFSHRSRERFFLQAAVMRFLFV